MSEERVKVCQHCGYKFNTRGMPMSSFLYKNLTLCWTCLRIRRQADEEVKWRETE